MPPPDRTLFADRLRTELRRSHMSQTTLAERVGVSQQTVSKWLNGETQPRLKVLPALADALGIEPADLSATLVEGTGLPPPDETIERRVAAIDRRVRNLTPGQLDRLEAYLRGLRDGAAS